MAPAEVEAAVIYQIGALVGRAMAEGGRLTHVKPHGALSNQACEDTALADCVARVVPAVDRELILLAPALSELSAAGARAGLRVVNEGFADRLYTDASTLAPRSQPGTVLHDDAAVVAHVMRMLAAGGIVAESGKVLAAAMHSTCVHGDTPGAVANAMRLRSALEHAGWNVTGLIEALAG